MKRNEVDSSRKPVFFIAGGLFAAALAITDEFIHERRVPAAVPFLLVILLVAIVLAPYVFDAKRRAHISSHFCSCASALGLQGCVALVLACIDWMFAAAVVVHFLFAGTTWAKEDANSERRDLRSTKPAKIDYAELKNVPVGISLAARAVGMRQEADAHVILRTIANELAPYKGEDATYIVNDLLAALTSGTYKDLNLLDGVLVVLPELKIAPNERSFEVLMEANFALGNVYEVVSLAARLGTQFTTARMQRLAANASALARDTAASWHDARVHCWR